MHYRSNQDPDDRAFELINEYLKGRDPLGFFDLIQAIFFKPADCIN